MIKTLLVQLNPSGYPTLETYRKSLKETRGSYFFIDALNAGLIQGRVSFKGGSYYSKE